MDRRRFLRNVATVSAAGLTLASLEDLAVAKPGKKTPVFPGNEKNLLDDRDAKARQPWLFFDLWHFDRIAGVVHRQARAQWRPEATYVDPLMFGHNSWPTVAFDDKSGKWRMWYSVAWKPCTLMLAESDDGEHWRPSPQADVKPPGEKLATHHLFTLDSGSAGGVYLDPRAEDSRPYKLFAHQQGEPVFRRALQDPSHRWHEAARREGLTRYMNEELTLGSRDGLHWEVLENGDWGGPDWHPEPPLFGFFNHYTGRHTMTVRPGWGDRRVCLQSSDDLKTWSGPRLLFQPDVLDPALQQHYGMPVFRYGPYYVGLLWVFHCSDSGPVPSFNQFEGPLDVQLTYSFDGERFFRGRRQPLIARNDPPEHGCGAIQSCSLVETDDELRIYSGSGKPPHGRSRQLARGKEDMYGILLHTLRKDGFVYLEPEGDHGELLTKPLALTDPLLTCNAQADFGEVRFQITDMESRPVEGYTFEDNLPLAGGDSLKHKIAWRDKTLDDVLGKVVRLQIRLRNARLYAIHGAFHFLDAQDRWMLDQGKR